MESKTFIVPNISCSHCVHTIQSEVGDLKGVKVVKADEHTKQVNVQWEAPTNWQEIERTLVEINYPPAK